MQLDLPIAKAEYLLNHSDDSGEGGDKQKYWRQVLGFDSANEIRQAILAEVSINMLNPHGKHPYGIDTLHQFESKAQKDVRNQF